MKLLYFLLLFFVIEGQAQKIEYKGFPSLVWPKLYNIGFQNEEKNEDGFQKPLFSKEVKLLAGKQVTLPGYLVPFEAGRKSQRFMLSSLPLNACFFCGVGGPETVVQVDSKDEVAYADKLVQVSGILKLNDSEPEKMIYILENAVFLGEIDF